MKMGRIVAVTLAAIGIIGGQSSISWAQSDTPQPSPSADVQSDQATIAWPAAMAEQVAQERQRAMIDAQKAMVEAQETGKFKMKFFGATQGPQAVDWKIRAAAARVRDLKGSAAQEAATKQLTELLDQYFEQDMKSRAQELNDIAARLEKLRAQLDRRRQKKQEIIDLQVKVALNEADGLGFYGSPSPLGPFVPDIDVMTPSDDATPVEEPGRAIVPQ